MGNIFDITASSLHQPTDELEYVCCNYLYGIIVVTIRRSNKPGKEKRERQAKWFNRLAVLETRADKRATLIWQIYLPVIFTVYALLLGMPFVLASYPYPHSLLVLFQELYIYNRIDRY